MIKVFSKVIEAGRGYAALSVLIFHVIENLKKDKYFGGGHMYENLFYPLGDVGVIFFFLLSGFLMAELYFKTNSFDVKKFILKRLIRIYPLFMITYVIVLFFGIATGYVNFSEYNYIQLLKGLFLFPQDSRYTGFGPAPIIIVAWSLHYELLFYIIFSFSAANKNIIKIIALVYFMLFIIKFFTPDTFAVRFLSSHFLLIFVFGVNISIAIRKKTNTIYNFKFIYLLACIFFAIYFFRVYHIDLDGQTKILYDFFVAIILGAGLFLLLLEEKYKKININKNILYIGSASYSIYLVHFPVVAVLSKISFYIFREAFLGFYISVCFVFIFSLIFSIAYYRLIERAVVYKFVEAFNKRLFSQNIGIKS